MPSYSKLIPPGAKSRKNTPSLLNFDTLTGDKIRCASRVIDCMSEDFVQSQKAVDLLKLVVAYWACGWDVMPDKWTKEQIKETLDFDYPPRFDEIRFDDLDGGTKTTIHALGVSDCPCPRCQIQKHNRESERRLINK